MFYPIFRQIRRSFWWPESYDKNSIRKLRICNYGQITTVKLPTNWEKIIIYGNLALNDDEKSFKESVQLHSTISYIYQGWPLTVFYVSKK